MSRLPTAESWKFRRMMRALMLRTLRRPQVLMRPTTRDIRKMPRANRIRPGKRMWLRHHVKRVTQTMIRPRRQACQARVDLTHHHPEPRKSPASLRPLLQSLESRKWTQGRQQREVRGNRKLRTPFRRLAIFARRDVKTSWRGTAAHLLMTTMRTTPGARRNGRGHGASGITRDTFRVGARTRMTRMVRASRQSQCKMTSPAGDRVGSEIQNSRRRPPTRRGCPHRTSVKASSGLAIIAPQPTETGITTTHHRPGTPSREALSREKRVKLQSSRVMASRFRVMSTFLHLLRLQFWTSGRK